MSTLNKVTLLNNYCIRKDSPNLKDEDNFVKLFNNYCKKPLYFFISNLKMNYLIKIKNNFIKFFHNPLKIVHSKDSINYYRKLKPLITATTVDYPYKIKTYLGVPQTKTYIFIQERIIIPKRFMHRASNFITKKAISPQMLLEQQRLIQNKKIFLSFCHHFECNTLAQLLNDKNFLDTMHGYIHNEPTLHSRAFQLALEVTYSKRKFNQTTLQEFYKNDFCIQDTFNVNNGICDQSTIYTSIIAKKISTYFNFDYKDLVVNSTPLYLTKDKITEPIKVVMDYNKKMTENTCPDFNIKGRPYDLKEQKDFSYGKNQVYLLDIERILKKGNQILDQVEVSLRNSLVNPQIKLSSEAEKFTQYLLKVLQNNRNSPLQNRLENLNSLLIKDNVPKDFKIPLFVPIKKAVIETVQNINDDKVPLDSGQLDFVKTKKAIMGILETHTEDVKFKIQQATHASIQFNIPKIEEDI